MGLTVFPSFLNVPSVGFHSYSASLLPIFVRLLSRINYCDLFRHMTGLRQCIFWTCDGICLLGDKTLRKASIITG